MAEEKKNIPKLRFREFTGDNANAWELRKLGIYYFSQFLQIIYRVQS